MCDARTRDPCEAVDPRIRPGLVFPHPTSLARPRLLGIFRIPLAARIIIVIPVSVVLTMRPPLFASLRVLTVVAVFIGARRPIWGPPGWPARRIGQERIKTARVAPVDRVAADVSVEIGSAD